MALTRNRLIGNLANATDSAASSSFLAKGATEANYQSIAYSDVTGKPTILDSAGITSIIDSSYIQARQGSAVAGLDSAGITSLVDSNYVVARAVASGSGYGRYNYTATAGQTVFQDSDNSGAVLSYTSGGIMVFYNGVMLKNTADWEGTDGSSVTLVEAADSGANVSIHKWTVASAGGGGGSAGIAWGGDRAVHHLGYNGSSKVNTLDYFDITSPGNASDFGDLNYTQWSSGSLSNQTYGVFSSDGYLDYVTIASNANASTFGSSSGTGRAKEGGCDGTTGIIHAANYGLEYITVATPANANAFGSMAVDRWNSFPGSDGTYFYMAGGTSPTTDIERVAFSTPGNSISVGDLSSARGRGGSGGNTTTMVCGGGGSSNIIDYFNMGSSITASDFGDLTIARSSLSGTSNETTVLFLGGEASSYTNIVDYVSISTPANATDFGDTSSSCFRNTATSGSPS